MHPFLWALLGGALIGLSATLFLVLNGRVTGISGILGGLIDAKQDRDWRLGFILGLIGGGVGLRLLAPQTLVSHISSSTGELVAAGFLVGFGTLLGSGCTSGHGVCGLSRLSIRSLVATLLFIGSGILTVWIRQTFF